MDLNFKELGGIVYGEFNGRLDTAAAHATDINEFIDNADKKIVFDCEKLEFISSAGLRILLALYKECRKKGGSITLKSVVPSVMRVFQVSGFANMFTIE
ncbi:MAG: STAS domain-containing protein [Prevotellaceae bacterium]|nr:STAS domain-containing protein [Prevotellaceae bacterium]